MGGAWTPWESLHWKLTLGEKSIATLGKWTCISSMRVQCSTTELHPQIPTSSACNTRHRALHRETITCLFLNNPFPSFLTAASKRHQPPGYTGTVQRAEGSKVSGTYTGGRVQFGHTHTFTHAHGNAKLGRNKVSQSNRHDFHINCTW